MIPEYFAVIGAVIASIGGVYYLFETITGRSKPNRITWLLWGLFPIVIFLAQKVQGVNGLSWATFVAGFMPFLIFCASFLNKKAYWKSRPMDYCLMIAALVGIILWAITNDPNLAILFALTADLLAGVPTIIKAYKHPETESWIAYGISAFGFGLGVLAIHTFNFQNAAFILYLFAANSLLTIFAHRKPAKNILHTEVG